MARFFDAFKEIVIPDLREKCRSQAFFVALEMETFDDAAAHIMHAAMKRGASSLTPAQYNNLEDWIETSLLKLIPEFEPVISRSALAADKVAADILRRYGQ